MHIADKIALALRPLILAVAVLALPVFFLSYGYMLKLAFDAWPMWAFICACIAHAVIWLSAAMLRDRQLERHQRQAFDRQ